MKTSFAAACKFEKESRGPYGKEIRPKYGHRGNCLSCGKKLCSYNQNKVCYSCDFKLPSHLRDLIVYEGVNRKYVSGTLEVTEHSLKRLYERYGLKLDNDVVKLLTELDRRNAGSRAYLIRKTEDEETWAVPGAGFYLPIRAVIRGNSIVTFLPPDIPTKGDACRRGPK